MKPIRVNTSKRNSNKWYPQLRLKKSQLHIRKESQQEVCKRPFLHNKQAIKFHDGILSSYPSPSIAVIVSSDML